MIEVKQTGSGEPLAFDVTVTAGGGSTHHRVTMDRDTATRLGRGHQPARCIEAAFRFLLDREPKEAIMRRFDVAVISRYFPDFEAALPGYLDHG